MADVQIAFSSIALVFDLLYILFVCVCQRDALDYHGCGCCGIVLLGGAWITVAATLASTYNDVSQMKSVNFALVWTAFGISAFFTLITCIAACGRFYCWKQAVLPARRSTDIREIGLREIEFIRRDV